jgi:hypothetical protein
MMITNLLAEAVRSAVGSPKAVEILTSSAKIGALTGAAAGAGVALVGGVASARTKSGEDGYAVLGQSLSQIGNGAVLGVVGALAASVTGLGVAALVGRGLLALAAPALVGTVVAAAVQGPVSRFTRETSDKLAGALRSRFGRHGATVQEPRVLPGPDRVVPEG